MVGACPCATRVCGTSCTFTLLFPMHLCVAPVCFCGRALIRSCICMYAFSRTLRTRLEKVSFGCLSGLHGHGLRSCTQGMSTLACPVNLCVAPAYSQCMSILGCPVKPVCCAPAHSQQPAGSAKRGREEDNSRGDVKEEPSAPAPKARRVRASKASVAAAAQTDGASVKQEGAGKEKGKKSEPVSNKVGWIVGSPLA